MMGFIVLAIQVIQYLSYNKSHIVNLYLFYNSIEFDLIDIFIYLLASYLWNSHY
jgi:hypothetical protein